MTEDDLAPLLETLCVEWGFCLSAEAVEAIVATPDLTGEVFADLVLAAEGVANPQGETYRERIATRFDRFLATGAA
jgi:hypothetical protein